MIEPLGHITDPGAVLAKLKAGDRGRAISFSFTHEPHYAADATPIALYVACMRADDGLRCVVVDDPALKDVVERDNDVSLDDIAGRFDTEVICLDRPLPLDTVEIPKPWGREIWYTGIEARGVSTVSRTPLPWLIALTDADLLGGADAPLLLKILDPLADAVYGDLYFEMHDRKVEVYIVTHVDPNAWPDGHGGIRFGFRRAKMAEFESLDSFRQAYIDAVNAYRDVRATIDAALDEFRRAEGFAPRDVVPVARLEAWRDRIDPELDRRERECREAMDDFTETYRLRVGDVVRVPPHTPHSLQHGVRVIEFQTPHYERYILSFGQKVLTQDDWDTAEAMDRVDWDSQFDIALDSVGSGEGWIAERAADFDEFEVQRIRLDRGASCTIPADTYAVAIGVAGTGSVNGHILDAECACLLPAGTNAIVLTASPDTACVMLLALPRSDD